MTFNIIDYAKSNAWVGNPYLVQHPTGVKKCESCGKLFYSIEYADHDEFTDGKVPCCNRCHRKKKKQENVHEIVAKYGVSITCKKCGKDKSASHFVARRGEWIEVNRNCDDCRTMPKVDYT
ncbi:MAG: hypothetical protein HC917_28725 [Richelia sp. SM2_1_7]|nr:hypothetical protein [Richelia sp. SM2_1_7]